MNIKKLAKLFEYEFECHKVFVKVNPCGTIPSGNSEFFVFKIRLKSGTKVKHVNGCLEDIKACLQCSVLELWQIEEQRYLLMSIYPDSDNRLMPILESQDFRETEMQIPVVLGYDIVHKPFLADLAELPHILYGGATGMGKSVALRNLILSAIWKNPSQNVNIVILDIGANDLDIFEGIQHLSHPIVKDEITGVYVAGEIVKEMERRIKLTSDERDELPAIILVIDEIASLLSNIDKKLFQKFSNAMANLLRRGRHAKIHVVIGTQDPTKENLKIASDNITASVAFRCHNHYSSQAIIGQSGAENLQGKGSMLYVSADCPAPVRIQGAYAETEELESAISRVKDSKHDLSNKFVIPEMQSDNPCDFAVTDVILDDTLNKEFAEIIMWTLSQQTVSANKLSNIFHIGNRSKDIICRLCNKNIVSEQNSKQARNVIPNCIDDISDETLEFLSKYGYSGETVSEVISKRIQQKMNIL